MLWTTLSTLSWALVILGAQLDLSQPDPDHPVPNPLESLKKDINQEQNRHNELNANVSTFNVHIDVR